MAKGEIKLNDLLHLSDEQIESTKIRFMVKRGTFDPQKEAADETKHDRLNLHHLVHNSESISFKKGIIAIGFVNVHDDYWLMTGVVSVKKDNGKNKSADAEYLNNKYNFRVVVKYHKGSQQGLRLAKGFIDTLKVFELWNPDKSIGDIKFPGYKNVSVNYGVLKNRIDTSDEWRTALSCRKGVYLITDTKTGKLYVGSAYGKDGILGRWKTYIKSGFDEKEVENGEFPNKKLRALVKTNGLSYVKDYFLYSILETFTDDVPDEYIIARESWWKDAFQSRKYGNNAN